MYEASTQSLSYKLRKLARFATIYGLSRTAAKAAGRLRISLPSFSRRRAKDVALIGCGQFGFSTIGYFLNKTYGSRIKACYDIDTEASQSLARALNVPLVCLSASELVPTAGLRILYIASNHASHTPYAVQAMRSNLDVYIEKPVAVTREQLVELIACIRETRVRVFAGYNRPFSGAIRYLRRLLHVDPQAGITLSCFVSGHRIAADHWYRAPPEGTRVCGNIGHWLDLMVHVFSWRGLPEQLDIAVSYSDEREPDDNMSITITSELADLFSIMLTSRSEPFEGINESINFQHANTICKIDDFRRMTVWQDERLIRRRFWPKDVGHRLAVLQPFRDQPRRDWHEVELSTLLMLHITEMVRARVRHSKFSLRENWDSLLQEIKKR